MAVVSRFMDLSGLLKGSMLVRRSSVMLAGVIGAKIVGILGLLLLARLYDAEAFGLLGLLQALVVGVAVVASLGYQPAIALPSRDDEGASVLWLSMGLIGISTVLATCLVALFRDHIAIALDAPALAGLIWWAPAFLIGMGLYEVVGYWLTRRRLFKRLAAARVILTLAIISIQIAAWFAGLAMGGLIVGLVLGTGVAATVLLFQVWRMDRRLLISGLSWQRIRDVARDHRQFPAYHAPASLLSSASMALIPLGLGFFFGPALVGIYWLADRVCGYLTNLVRQTMQQIFLHRAAEVFNDSGDLGSLFRRTTLGLVWLALPPTLVFIAAGPFVFGVAFGVDWVEAGTFARWLGVAWLFAIANIPAVQLASVYRLQHWTLVYGLGLLIFRSVAVIAGGLAGDALLVIMIHALGNAVCSLGLVLAMAAHLRRRRTRPGTPAPVLRSPLS